jgi:hypothetical protein
MQRSLAAVGFDTYTGGFMVPVVVVCTVWWGGVWWCGVSHTALLPWWGFLTCTLQCGCACGRHTGIPQYNPGGSVTEHSVTRLCSPYYAM